MTVWILARYVLTSATVKRLKSYRQRRGVPMMIMPFAVKGQLGLKAAAASDGIAVGIKRGVRRC
jgi:hypothetical protein